MNLNLKDKLIVVSGGGKGIGEGIVRVLADEGAIPLIVDRDENASKTLTDELRSKGHRADYFIAELTDPKSCEETIKKVIEKYHRIDGLVNDAGVNDGVGLENGSYDEFIASLHKNVIHYYLLAHFALPALKESKGAIVNITSKTAETGQGGTSGYAASNGARNGLTREWAVELLKYNIRVNAVVVAESFTPLYKQWISTFENPKEKLNSITRKIPLEHRMTTPEEIGNTVAFLLSHKSSHTTGQLIHVDGGYVHLDRAIE